MAPLYVSKIQPMGPATSSIMAGPLFRLSSQELEPVSSAHLPGCLELCSLNFGPIQAEDEGSVLF